MSIKVIRTDIHQAIKLALSEEPHLIQRGVSGFEYKGLKFTPWETCHNGNCINYVVEPMELFDTVCQLFHAHNRSND